MKIMKKANNLIIGAIYINGVTSNPCRLVGIVSCQGVYLETYDGQGYGDLVKFENVFYADMDEVEDYLADSRVYDASNKAPSHKVMHSWERQVDMNGDVYIREDEDYLDRD